jgi:hypothetical protein
MPDYPEMKDKFAGGILVRLRSIDGVEREAWPSG